MTETDRTLPNAALAFAHIAWWFAHCPGELIAGTQLNPNKTEFFTEPAQAASWATMAAVEAQVYIRQTTLARRPDGLKRGSDEETASMPGLWFDIDIADDGHKTEKKLPETLDVALGLIGLIPPPSAIVHSGGGLYALYRFGEPQTVATAGSIEAMAKLSNDAQLSLQRIWAGAGDYHMDNLGDLSRILRPAGTLNHKLEQPRPVGWVLKPEDGAGDYDAVAIVDTLVSIASQYPDPEPPPAPVSTRITLPDRPIMKGGQHSIIDTFHEYTTLMDVLSEDSEVWELARPEGRWERWKRAGTKAEYSIKMDTTTGVVIVWSDTVASRWGLPSGRQGFTLWQIMAAIHGHDAHRLATDSLSAARTASPLPVSSACLDRAWQSIVTAMAAEAPADTNGSPDVMHTTTGVKGVVAATANLPADFWTARPDLESVRAAAWGRGISPDAVLCALLGRLAASIAPYFRIPPAVGAGASLTFYGALCGPPGTGKSSAISTARDLFPIYDIKRVLEGGQLGSGEGLIEMYMELVEEDDGNGKKIKVKKQNKHGAFVTLDEGTALAEMSGRKGSTILSNLRSMWTGSEPVGQENASTETKRRLAAKSFTLGFIMGLQPEKAGHLLDDTTAGTPQRFVWASSIDPNIPRSSGEIETIRPIEWRPPSLDQEHSNGDLSYPASVVRAIQEAHHDRQTGLVVVDELEAHAGLARLKVAGLLAMLDGSRLEVTMQDWELSGSIMEVSTEVRNMTLAAVVEAIERDAKANDERAISRAIRLAEGTKDAAGERYMTLLDQMTRSVYRKVSAAGPDGVTTREARHATAGAHRKEVPFDEVLLNLQELMWITPHSEDENRWILGAAGPREA